MKPYIFFEIRSPTYLKLNICVIITFQKGVHHTPLKINFYSHMAFLRVLITTNNIELLTTNYEHKILIITPYILKITK
jgi:hypothetical protein